MRQPRTQEGMIRYIAKMHCEGNGLPYYKTAKEYSRCPKWKEAISIEAKKIRKEVRDPNSGKAWINRLKK